MHIIITGASRGIGYELAKFFAKQAENKILLLSRNVDRLQELSANSPHANIDWLAYDLTRAEEAKLLEKIKPWNHIDILVNNAGQLLSKPFTELTRHDWESIFTTNLFGVVDLVRLLLPKLEAANHGHVLNIGSMGGFQGSSKFPGLSAYSASKAALANLTECLAEEYKEKGPAFNCLSLGAVQTEMLAEAFPGYEAPVGSQDMGAFIAWFATNGHRFFNGKILPVSISTP
ncbi:MAG: short-chain dehydrogenase [Saprospiraceae bacterium]|nr:MAG: short-chain dehydrogenase [Saprospiraceae bacterium]